MKQYLGFETEFPVSTSNQLEIEKKKSNIKVQHTGNSGCEKS